MTAEEKLRRFGVALLAPRSCFLGEDPCGGSEVVLWEDAGILGAAGIPVRVYARAARNGAPVSVIPLRSEAPLITSLEYGGQFSAPRARGADSVLQRAVAGGVGARPHDHPI